MFKVLNVDHIGIAVKDAEEAKRLYTELLGMPAADNEVYEELKIKLALIPSGDTMLELVESTAPDGPTARFVEKKGNGIHHIALRVDNIHNALQDLSAKGVRLLDKQPRTVTEGYRVAFIDPKAAGGILLELVERK